MKLLQIYINQSCNYKCPQCPMKKWTYEQDELDLEGNKYNRITNFDLIPWVDEMVDPAKTVVQIDGGEPALYSEINTLVQDLQFRNFGGLIRTNGSLPIPQIPNFKRIAAWHQGKPMPKYYDLILIFRNALDNWEEKEQYCKDNGIPYTVFNYMIFDSKSEHGDQSCCRVPTETKCGEVIDAMATIYASGKIGKCFVQEPSDGLFSNHRNNPIEWFPLCSSCGSGSSVEYFLRKTGLWKDGKPAWL